MIRESLVRKCEHRARKMVRLWLGERAFFASLKTAFDNLNAFGANPENNFAQSGAHL
jgi:hypothetical protein